MHCKWAAREKIAANVRVLLLQKSTGDSSQQQLSKAYYSCRGLNQYKNVYFGVLIRFKSRTFQGGSEEMALKKILGLVFLVPNLAEVVQLTCDDEVF